MKVYKARETDVAYFFEICPEGGCKHKEGDHSPPYELSKVRGMSVEDFLEEVKEAEIAKDKKRPRSLPDVVSRRL